MYIHTLQSQGLISTRRKDLIVKETAKDEELQTLLQYIQQGWPKQYKDVDHKVRPYYHHCRAEYTYQKGIIMKRVRTVIPQTTRRPSRCNQHHEKSTSFSVLAKYGERINIHERRLWDLQQIPKSATSTNRNLS